MENVQGDCGRAQGGDPPMAAHVGPVTLHPEDLALLDRIAAELEAEPMLVVPQTGGPDLARAIAEHTAADTLADVSSVDVGELAAACQRLMSWASAAQAALITELSRRPEMQPTGAGAGFDSVSARASTAIELTELLRLTTGQANTVAAESNPARRRLPAHPCGTRHGRAEPAPGSSTPGRVAPLRPCGHRPGRRSGARPARHARSAFDEVAAAGETGTSRDRPRGNYTAPQARRRGPVCVKVTPAEDGMAWLEAFLPAETAIAVKTSLDAAATALRRRDAAAGDPRARTMDQRRADALAMLAWASLGTGVLGGTTCPTCSTENPSTAPSLQLGTTQGRPVTVNVTIPLTTLLGLDDEPGELAGYGPIPAALARELSAAGVWRWVGTHPVTAMVLDHGRTRYVPTKDLVDHVVLRDQTCRAPGCTVPASRCQLDHTVPYPHGPTNPANLGPLCGKHHRLKHHTRWQLQRTSPAASRGPVPPDAPAHPEAAPSP